MKCLQCYWCGLPFNKERCSLRLFVYILHESYVKLGPLNKCKCSNKSGPEYHIGKKILIACLSNNTLTVLAVVKKKI